MGRQLKYTIPVHSQTAGGETVAYHIKQLKKLSDTQKISRAQEQDRITADMLKRRPHPPCMCEKFLRKLGETGDCQRHAGKESGKKERLHRVFLATAVASTYRLHKGIFSAKISYHDNKKSKTSLPRACRKAVR